jgi:hypothetical protein
VPSLFRVLFLLVFAYLLIAGVVYVFQRSLVFHPTHFKVDSVMESWVEAGQNVGYVRAVESPAGVWLVLHGNGGQAAHREYLLEQVADDMVVYVLEYPGYGDRPGLASADNFNASAREAYAAVRELHPGIPVGLIGESIGSGPASVVASGENPPAKVVLLVPFDQFYRVAGERFPWLPVKWLLRDQWDNGAALRDYRGQIEIYAAPDDEVIPFKHARSLADKLPAARLIELSGGHNSWQWAERFELPTAP